MKSIHVPAIGGVGELHDLVPNAIDVDSWDCSAGAPVTAFRVGYDSKCLYILYDVAERNPLRTKTADFEQVCEDSCVEFFCEAPGGRYYNFEFNANGVGTFASRVSRKVDKRPLDWEQALGIGRQPHIGQDSWQLLVSLPWSLLGISPQKGVRLRGNFYKCGDKTAQPHYLSWNKIDTDKPDFHRPEYFGELILQ